MYFSKISTLLFLLNSWNVAVVSGSNLRRTQEVNASPRNSEFCPTTRVPSLGDPCRTEGIDCAYRPVTCKKTGETFYVESCYCSQGLDLFGTGNGLEFQCFTMAMSADCNDAPDIQIDPAKPERPTKKPKPPAEKPIRECPPSPPFGLQKSCSVETPTPCKYNPYQCRGEDIVHHDTHCYCEGGKFECVQARPICENGFVKPNKPGKPDGNPGKPDGNPGKPNGNPGKPNGKPCTKEMGICADGTAVGRDSFNDCKYQPCPDGSIATRPGGKPDKPDDPKQDDKQCTQDMKTCEDGTEVGRDPKNDCQYEACPGESDDTDGRDVDGPNDVVCKADVMDCPDGSHVSRDPKNKCEFPLCPDEARKCPKDPPNVGDKCAPSRAPLICNYDKRKCPDETTYTYLTKCECKKNGIFDCTFIELLCGRDSCPEDLLECPDGSILRPNPDCQFPECPTVDVDESFDDDETMACPEGEIQCKDGSWVGRDENNKCNFHPCPEPDCIECTNKLARYLEKKGKTCASFNDRQLKKKCMKKQWKKKEFCQFSCFEAGVGYIDEICCAKKEE